MTTDPKMQMIERIARDPDLARALETLVEQVEGPMTDQRKEDLAYAFFTGFCLAAVTGLGPSTP